MSTRVNLIGRTSGRLTVISFAEIRGKNAYWRCKCSCGNEVTVVATLINKGKATSCGCIRKENGKLYLSGNTFGRKNYGEASSNSLWHRYRRSARLRKISWNLTKEQFLSLTKQNCHYCDAEPSLIEYRDEFYGEYIYNSLDRINSDEGYETANIVPACKLCQFAKGSMHYQVYIDLANRIAVKHPVANASTSLQEPS